MLILESVGVLVLVRGEEEAKEEDAVEGEEVEHEKEECKVVTAFPVKGENVTEVEDLGKGGERDDLEAKEEGLLLEDTVLLSE